MGIRLEVRPASGHDAGAPPVVLEFDQSRITLGRAASADVPLPHASVSGLHATIRTHHAGYAVFDEGSTNGTRVGDVRVPEGRAKPLRTGDLIRIGPYLLVVEAGIPVSRSASADQTAAAARRLLASPEATRSRPTLTVTNGPSAGRFLELPEAPSEVRIGRSEEAELPLEDADCSRDHAVVAVDESGALIRDLGSKNGVTVNDRVVQERRLRDRDEIRLGNTVLVFEDPIESALSALRAAPDEIASEPVELPPPPGPAPEPMGVEPVGTVDGAMVEFVEPAPIEAAPKREPKATTAARRENALTDGIVYALAAIVLVLSVTAMYFLMLAE